MNINNLFKRSKSTVSKHPPPEPAPPMSTASSNVSSASSQQLVSGDVSGRRRMGHRDTNDTSSAPSFPGFRSTDSHMPRGSSAQPIPSLYTNDHEMYTQNDLANFSFGAAQSSYAPSIIAPAVDPLSPYDGCEDHTRSDTTPRPSVANYHERGDPSQSGSRHRRPENSSRDSNNRSGYAPSSRPISQVSHQDLTSEDESHGRHRTTSSTSGSRSQSRHPDEETQLYLSEEDVDLDDIYEHDEPDAFVPQRSQSIAIPGPRDNYSRRPSKSMDDLRSRNTGPNAGPSTSATGENYSPSMGTSYPGTQVDWMEARKRSMQLDKDSPLRDKELPAIRNQDGNTLTASSSGSALDLDPSSWLNFSKNGLVNIDMSEMSDIMQIGPSSVNEQRAYAIRKSSMVSSTARRQSTVSSNTDIMYKNAHGVWATLDTKLMWVFSKKSSDRESSNHQGGPDSFKQKDKVKRWNGMQVGHDEIWQNPSTGRFTVCRRNNSVEGKPHAPQQQRVNIHLYLQPQRTGSLSSYYRLQTTIHRHSRTRAFSLYRTYRKTIKESQAGHRKKSEPSQQPRNQPMILLAPIDVQRNSTSTNTTRRLESHGLLDESDKRVHRDAGAHPTRERTHERPSGTDKARGKQPVGSGREPASNSSAGSVANAIAAASSEPFVDLKLASQMALTQRRNQGLNEGSSRQHLANSASAYGLDEEEEEDIDEDLDGRPKKPTRTPHSEAFGSLPPAALEQAQQQQPRFSLWGLKKTTPAVRPDYQQPYLPSWPTINPNSNNQKYVVDDLNTSFTGLGLLPPIGEKNGSSSSGRRTDHRHGTRKGKERQLDDSSIFAHIPPDTLFMILPLWPRETESADGRDIVILEPPPINNRLYLIVLYRLQPSRLPPEHHSSKIKSGDKKRGQSSSTEESNHVLITAPFQMSARVISHHDLQGTGIRIPGQGLAVCGSIEEAELEMPRTVTGNDYIIIGLCNNRQQGIEFLPYGFATLGLAKALNVADNNKGQPINKAAVRDEFNSDDDVAYLATPIGRAVMEMAFAGSIAVSSFAPNSA